MKYFIQLQHQFGPICECAEHYSQILDYLKDYANSRVKVLVTTLSGNILCEWDPNSATDAAVGIINKFRSIVK